jgi:hypothetical protein
MKSDLVIYSKNSQKIGFQHLGGSEWKKMMADSWYTE